MSPRNSMNATLVSEAEMKDMVTEYTLQSSKDQFLTYDDYIANYRDTKIPLQQMELWETVNGNFIVMDVNTSNTDLSIRTDCSGDFSEMAKQLELNLMKIESIGMFYFIFCPSAYLFFYTFYITTVNIL